MNTKSTDELVIELLEAVDKGEGVIDASSALARHFNIEFRKGKWQKRNMDAITRRVSCFFELPIEDINSKKRNFELVNARFIIVVERLKTENMSLGKAGEIFGYNHATVLYAKKQIEGNDTEHTKRYEMYLKTKY